VTLRISLFPHFLQVQTSFLHRPLVAPMTREELDFRIMRSPQNSQTSGRCVFRAFSRAVTRSSKVARRLPKANARLAHALILLHNADRAERVNVMSESDSRDGFAFSHAELGMTRFPPNVEQITVEHEEYRSWLITRRNDVMLRFPLTDEDCRYLASLLIGDRHKG